MNRLAAILLLTLPALICAEPQHLTRRLPPASRRTAATAAAEPCDTIRDRHITDSVTVAGFDKPLRSVRESMFVTNRTTDSITGLGIEISYYDTQHRLLHRAAHAVSCDIPASETRRIEVRSFDRVGSFHYRLSPLPRGTRAATPFDATVRVTYILLPKR